MNTATAQGAADSSHENVVRLLLPGRTRDGTPRTWVDIATTTSYPDPVDGYTDWTKLVELRPGIDVATLPTAAAGLLDPTTIRDLTTALRSTARQTWSWSGATNPDLATEQKYPSLDNLLAALHGHFHGHAASRDGTITIAAPPYADSLLLTGPPTLLHHLRAQDLEAHPVDPHLHIPIWVD